MPVNSESAVRVFLPPKTDRERFSSAERFRIVELHINPEESIEAPDAIVTVCGVFDDSEAPGESDWFVRSPHAGVIADIGVQVGDIVDERTVLCRIDVDADVPERLSLMRTKQDLRATAIRLAADIEKIEKCLKDAAKQGRIQPPERVTADNDEGDVEDEGEPDLDVRAEDALIERELTPLQRKQLAEWTEFVDRYFRFYSTNFISAATPVICRLVSAGGERHFSREDVIQELAIAFHRMWKNGTLMGHYLDWCETNPRTLSSGRFRDFLRLRMDWWCRDVIRKLTRKRGSIPDMPHPRDAISLPPEHIASPKFGEDDSVTLQFIDGILDAFNDDPFEEWYQRYDAYLDDDEKQAKFAHWFAPKQRKLSFKEKCECYPKELQGKPRQDGESWKPGSVRREHDRFRKDLVIVAYNELTRELPNLDPEVFTEDDDLILAKVIFLYFIRHDIEISFKTVKTIIEGYRGAKGGTIW